MTSIIVSSPAEVFAPIITLPKHSPLFRPAPFLVSLVSLFRVCVISWPQVFPVAPSVVEQLFLVLFSIGLSPFASKPSLRHCFRVFVLPMIPGLQEDYMKPHPTILLPMSGLQNLPKVRRELLTTRMMIETDSIAPAVVERPITTVASTSVSFSTLSSAKSPSASTALLLQIRARRPLLFLREKVKSEIEVHFCRDLSHLTCLKVLCPKVSNFLRIFRSFSFLDLRHGMLFLAW